MNILIINFEFPPLGGGGGVATKQLAEELAKKHQITVITTKYQNTPSHETIEGVEIYRVPVYGRTSLPTASLISMLTFVPTAIWKGMQLMRKSSFSVINAQFVLPSGVPAAFLSWLFKVPLVVSFIGGDIYDPTKGISPHRHFLLRFAIKIVSAQATLCTAISTDTKIRAQKLHGIKKEIIITPLGLVPQHITTKTKKELGLLNVPFLAVSIGRLIPRKSYPVLLEALRQLPNNVGLVVIGDGPLKESLLEWIQKNNLEARVQLLGFVEESKKLEIVQACNIYVSAAEHEGFGIVFLEAMQCGLPIIAVNEGGQTDFLVQRVNALLVEPHKPEAIVKAVTELLQNTALRQSLRDNNIAKVSQFYLDKTAETFEKVLLKATHL